MPLPERRLQDYLPADSTQDDLDTGNPAVMRTGTSADAGLGGSDVRREVPEHVTITCYPQASHHPTYWTAVWWHATSADRTGKAMIIEESGDIESERPDEAIDWARARCTDIRIATPTTGGYVPLGEYRE